MRAVPAAIVWVAASMTPGAATAQVPESDKPRLEPIMRIWAYESSPAPRIAVTREAGGRMHGQTLERGTVCGRRARVGTIVWRDLRSVGLTSGERSEGKIAKYEGTVCDDPRRWIWILWRNADGSLRGGDGEAGTEIAQTFAELPPRDTDGDALPDSDEIIGADVDGNGTVDVDLPRLGADHLQKDLFLEIDSMPGRRLSDGAVAEVVRAFRRAPLPNPGGRQGVALHVDNGPSSIRWRRHLTSGGSPWRAFDAVKRDHFDHARARYFRYAISIHEIEPLPPTRELSGETREFGGSDFIVALGAACPGRVRGCPITREQQAGTFMHELGHALGLRHGGLDDTNYKPNHLSVMNGYFVATGLRAPSGPVFDFTRDFDAVPIDEGALDERRGIAAPASLASFTTMWRCPELDFLQPFATPFNITTDLNCDGVIASDLIKASINGDLTAELLTVGAEWRAIRFGPLAAAARIQARIREPAVAELLRNGAALLGDRRRPVLRMRRVARRTVRVTASDDRGLDQILVRIGSRTRRTPYASTGRRRLALTVRAGRVSAIALDRAGRYSAPASRGNSG